MNFLQLIKNIEQHLKESFVIELLEAHHLPYSFGSGKQVYRIQGHNLQIVFDGKEQVIKILLSPRHEKYPNDKWRTIFQGSPIALFENGIESVKKELAG